MKAGLATARMQTRRDFLGGIVAAGPDRRFLDELKRELKA